MNFKTCVVVLAEVSALSLVCCTAAACQEQHLPARSLTINTAQGGRVAIEAEIARTPQQRETGLMYRKSLADGKGMLFVFDSNQQLTFWMKNTLIPLSVAYISADGVIEEIHAMQPKDLQPIYSRTACRYALETPQGWFSRAGVKTGDRLGIPPNL